MITKNTAYIHKQFNFMTPWYIQPQTKPYHWKATLRWKTITLHQFIYIPYNNSKHLSLMIQKKTHIRIMQSGFFFAVLFFIVFIRNKSELSLFFHTNIFIHSFTLLPHIYRILFLQKMIIKMLFLFLLPTHSSFSGLDLFYLHQMFFFSIFIFFKIQ